MPHRTPGGLTRPRRRGWRGLADYAQRPTGGDLREKCIHGGARGFQATTRAGQKRRCWRWRKGIGPQQGPDPSLRAELATGEQPTSAQIEEAIDVFLDTMGLVGHQTLYGLHADTDNVHLH